MMHKSIKHSFVEFIPKTIDAGVIYVSMEYGTATHLCCCGCGEKVVTPITPTDWKLIYDGVSISLTPSIGNWSFECQSHYWVKRGKVVWAGVWSQDKIDENRLHARLRITGGLKRIHNTKLPNESSEMNTNGVERTAIWPRLLRYFLNK